MGGLLQDVRIAARRLVQAPGLTLIVVLTFALGIGANTALFTLFDRVIVRPLPVREPDRLVLLHGPGTNRGMISRNKETPFPMSHPMYEAIRDTASDFAGVLAYFSAPAHLAAGDQPERVDAELVTGTYFPVLGLTATRGRLFQPSDDEAPMGHPVVVLGHAYWMRRFAGDAAVIGTTVTVNALPMQVVGVAPPTFTGLEVGRDPAIYVPMAMKRQLTPTWDMLDDPRALWMTAVARLRDGVTLEQATASANVLYAQILAGELAQMSNVSDTFRQRFLAKKLELLDARSGASGFREQNDTPLRILVTTAALVLLVACLNVANLLFVRATRRQREMAVRLSLGAGRARLVRQLIVEGGLLALLGTGAGLVVAAITLPFLVGLLPDPDLRRAMSTAIDGRMLVFALGAGLSCVLLSAVLPAWQATRTSLTPALREGAGATAAGGQRIRTGLVVAQVALSLGLVFGAGLLVRTLARLTAATPGFEVTRLMTFSVSPELAGYPN
ncbi:MAG: ABC transporter permease, partial [Acidobacteria bacterium]|nr:ABC transporter permease [Acidobacteriota bacterium]